MPAAAAAGAGRAHHRRIDSNTAVVVLTHVHYKTAAIHDMRAITAKAHEHGALVIWDLSHSAGAIEST